MENTILFVDDELAILNAIKRVFRKSPYKVLTASSGEEAIQILESTPISVLISDYSMPDLTGAKLLAKAKTIRPDTVRIILSGNNDQEATIESINNGGAARFLTKPWDDNNLIAEVENAMTAWESNQYVCREKQILTQTAAINLIESLSTTVENDSVVVACIGVIGLDTIKNNTGVNGVTQLLTDLAPASNTLDDNVTLAITNDQNFCAVIQNAHESITPEQMVAEVVSTFSTKYLFNEQNIPISFHAGFVILNENTVSFEELISNAYTALQEAKSTNSDDAVAYDNGMDIQTNRRLIVESNLYEALEKNEFVLYYQPKIDARSGTLHGAEALIRWNNKTLGLVPPFEFIPLAEQSKLINDIGEWVTLDAVNQWANWYSEQTEKPVVSVNVSPRQLKDPQFIQRIENCLTASKIDPALLELEITENLMVENLDSTLDVLHEIKQLGLTLSIDDFGTGYSSLSYLHKLPADIIKIDRSFILPMLESPENTELVKNLIRLGHDMNMQIVAEGVECEQQLTILREFGCDVIQGYFFSPPVPATEFFEFSNTLKAHAASYSVENMPAAAGMN